MTQSDRLKIRNTQIAYTIFNTTIQKLSTNYLAGYFCCCRFVSCCFFPTSDSNSQSQPSNLRIAFIVNLFHLNDPVPPFLACVINECSLNGISRVLSDIIDQLQFCALTIMRPLRIPPLKRKPNPSVAINSKIIDGLCS